MIVPLRVATECSTSRPRTLTRAAWRWSAPTARSAGTVTDLWIDRAEPHDPLSRGRASAAARRAVLVPMTLATRRTATSGRSTVERSPAAQFAGAPARGPDQITQLEEDRSCAYFARRPPLRHARALGAAPVSEHDASSHARPARPLPAGETILWQGSPDWRRLARRAFHVRAWSRSTSRRCSPGRRRQPASTARRAGGRCGRRLWFGRWRRAAIGLLTLLAWLTARTTIYTITNRRVVLRVGIALPMSINLPFALIAARRCGRSPTARRHPTRHAAGERIAYADALAARAALASAGPSRCCAPCPSARAVARVLARALAAAAGSAGAAGAASAALGRPRAGAAGAAA